MNFYTVGAVLVGLVAAGLAVGAFIRRRSLPARQWHATRRRRPIGDRREELMREQLRACKLCDKRDPKLCRCWFSQKRLDLLAHSEKQPRPIKKLLT